MTSATILERMKRERREFNPTRKEDLAELRYFLRHNKWRNGCPFKLQDEFSEIPYQCLKKFTLHGLSRMKLEEQL